MKKRTISLLLACALGVPAAAAAADPEAPAPAIEIRPPGPIDPSRLAAVRLWHARYAREVAPVRRALGTVLAERRHGMAPPLLAACRALDSALGGLDRKGLFPAPDFAVNSHLTATLDRLEDAAGACLARSVRNLTFRLEQAEEAIANAELALRRYRLRP